MKIIIAPSKTQKSKLHDGITGTIPVFQKEADRLAKQIQNLPKDTLEKKMNINGLLLLSTYNLYQDYHNLPVGHALMSYTGTVFKELQLDQVNLEKEHYINNHLRILSALYGVLMPYDLIKPYRLDMKMGLHKVPLYQFWKLKLEAYFSDEVIVNLASNEYATLVNRPMISIEFRECGINGTYKNIGYYAKVARGKMLANLIDRNILDVEQIKTITFDGYSFNAAISTQKQWFFTR
jgi:cytoplasmic iron level regulating protein YaaA (DUF328/UPF0246 family)